MKMKNIYQKDKTNINSSRYINIYEKKYLKYKQKYLELKNQINQKK